MPELPDLQFYLDALTARVAGRPLERVRLASPFVLRSVDPPIDIVQGRVVRRLHRLGKRIVFDFGEELFLVFHLMIAGRLRWEARGQAVPKKLGLAAFDFPEGTLLLTEAGSRKRASLHVVRGDAALAAHDPGGIDALEAALDAFRAAITRENHTLKRALTDPRLLSGIGNAYSDEILHRARMSPLKLTSRLSAEEIERLHRGVKDTLRDWIGRLRMETGDGFPRKVTAFRDGMAVHGRYGRPCADCATLIQRIVYAGNECNYCPACQTGGRLLADRGMSRLLREDWPKSLEAWEEHVERRKR